MFFLLVLTWEVLDTPRLLRGCGNLERQSPNVTRLALTEHLQYGRRCCEHHTCVNASFCRLQQSYTHFTVEETEVQFLGVPKDTQLWRGRAGVWT